MKKLLLLLALVGMVAVGCTANSTDDDQNPPTEQPGPSGDEDLSFTNNTNTAPTISHEGGTAKISFTASLSWSVSVYADWLSVSPDEGEAGNGKRNSFSSAKDTARLPSRFWNGFLLNASSFSEIAAFNSARERNCWLRSAAKIQVETTPNEPSTKALSLGLLGRAGMIAVP